MSWIKTLSSIMLITIILFELMSFGITKMGLFLINKTPLVYSDKDDTIQDIMYGRTEREAWGAWHVMNGTFRHSESCFDILMKFNEVGARDESFKNLLNNSLILLGDSFAEGYGVSYEDTSQFIIEKNMGFSVANFGSSGNFGPLQELILYKNYLNLPHQGLIVFVLPANDFTDNDAKFWAEINQKRYRPYFSSGDKPLVPFYFSVSIKKDNFVSGINGWLKQFVKKYFWSANALRTFSVILRGDAINANLNKSYFYDTNTKQQSHLLLAYEEILDLANEKDVLFVIIPSGNDINRNQLESKPDSYKQQLWYQGFKSFESRQHHRVSVLNLMDYLPINIDELFFTCDGHWNPNGNKWAALTIINHIKKKNFFNSSVTR